MKKKCFPGHRPVLSEQRPVLLMVGTRPETIKLAPLYQELCEKGVSTLLCSAGQHAELLQDALTFFHIRPDVAFHIMKKNQDLCYITREVLEKSKRFFKKIRPSLVVVQGDTTTAMASAMAAFYLKIPIAHVEAGLRSKNIHGPFPEEMNRRLITMLSSYHFAPTERAVKQLLEEKVDQKTIFCTGNTVVDALFAIQKRIQQKEIAVSPVILKTITEQKAQGKKILLLTAHRRESFEGGLQSIFRAIKRVLLAEPHLFCLFPLHPNPGIQKALDEVKLSEAPNILITAALPYQDLVYALSEADLIATDSGGIQEEGASIHKPVLVLRAETDRPEAGSILVGTDEAKIVAGIRRMLKFPHLPRTTPYGDGTASKQIAHIIQGLVC